MHTAEQSLPKHTSLEAEITEMLKGINNQLLMSS
jgi:hypothetical protein